LAKRFQRRRFFKIDQSEKNCLWRPCFLKNRGEMCNRYRGPSIDALYQDLIHLAKQFQRRFKKIDQSKSRIAFGVLFINGSGQNKQSS
jgi:hypothetical protein